MSQASHLIKQLALEPHIEGGYFRQTYASSLQLTPENTLSRSLCTAVYYLLEGQDYSAWHQLKSDEILHHYCGSEVAIYRIRPDGTLLAATLGNPLHAAAIPQYVIPHGDWFAFAPIQTDSFALMGATVAPGFSYDDFQLGRYETLAVHFPHHANLIKRFCRS